MLADNTIVRNKDRSIPMRTWLKVRKWSSQYYRPALNEEIRRKLDGIEFTVFSNNCLGGVFYHDAGRQFTSPTINMAFDGEDFIKFCENPKHYFEWDKFDFFKWPGHDYPLARIDDIEARFVHYHSENECIEKWRQRASRVVWDNIFIIATDVDGMYQEKWMERFDKLPYENKIMFVAREWPQYNWTVRVPAFKNRNCVHILTDFTNCRGQRYYETAFDIAGWISQKTRD